MRRQFFVFFLVSAAAFALSVPGELSPLFAREAGWVPIPPPSGKTYQLPDRPGTQEAKSKKKNLKQGSPVATTARHASNNTTVYGGEPAVTEQELFVFLGLLPQFRAWTRATGEEAHPIINEQGKPDFLFSPKAAKWVEEHNFRAQRFFCVMGRMAAGVAIVEDGNDASRPSDMPEVTPEELNLVRKHLGELLTAGGAAHPLR